MTSTLPRPRADHTRLDRRDDYCAVDYASLRIFPARHPWRWVGSLVAVSIFAALIHTLATNPQPN